MQIALGDELLLLGVEHIDVQARADAVAHLVGTDRRLAGLRRLHQGLDLRLPIHSRGEGLPDLRGELPTRGFQLRSRLVAQRNRLTDPRLRCASRIERKAELQADLDRAGT